jgi:DNA helicase-2/ATP-dependent DNA helicase PcrA
MTLHNAKGLEFPVVFLTGLERASFHSPAPGQSLTVRGGAPPVLRRHTRAEDVLFLSHARGRRRNGEFMPSLPSTFLRELPKSLLKERSTIKLRGSGRGLDDGAAWGRATTWFGDPTTHRCSRHRPPDARVCR